MHGLGNDFVVIDNTAGSVSLRPEQISAMADRHTGIGFDQLLLVETASVAGAEFDYRIFNADGGEVEHCGNGARCFARFVHERGLTKSTHIPVNTAAGRLVLHLLDDGRVTVNMGVPNFAESSLPFDADPGDAEPGTDQDALLKHPDGTYSLTHGEETGRFGIASLGNPHISLFVDDVATAPVHTLGPWLESHRRFPARVNVGFLEIVSRGHARLRVYERGVGETRACGSGACAAVAIARKLDLLDESVSLTLPGGDLDIRWAGAGSPVEMTGPCSTVFEGRLRM